MSHNKNRGLYLLFSIDIVNSTLFKNRTHIGDIISNRKSKHSWKAFYLEFHSKFIKVLSKSIGNRKEDLKFTFLKSMGDELIFYTKIQKSTDIIHYLNFILIKIQRFREEYVNKHSLINFKGTAWLAGVPTINMIHFNKATKLITDFNGPQIDIGFRISKFASVERFIISLEIVYCLSLIKLKLKEDEKIAEEEKKIAEEEKKIEDEEKDEEKKLNEQLKIIFGAWVVKSNLM